MGFPVGSPVGGPIGDPVQMPVGDRSFGAPSGCTCWAASLLQCSAYSMSIVADFIDEKSAQKKCTNFNISCILAKSTVGSHNLQHIQSIQHALTNDFMKFPP